MNSVVFTEQFYFPEGWGGAQLPRDLTTHLAERGIRVEVICGSDQYAPQEADDHIPDPRAAGVVIRRVPRLFGGAIHSRKLLKQLWFYVASVPLLILRRAPDVFVTQTNPPLLVPLVAIAAWLRRRPFIIIAQDMYPEVMFAHGMARPDSVSGRVLSKLFAWAYGRAKRVVALGDVMAQRLLAKGVASSRIEIIPNWATGDESIERGARNKLRSAWGLDDCFVVLYSGNMGIAHDVTSPLRMLQRVLPRHPHVRLLFIGGGSRLAEAKQAAKELGVEHAVQFRPLVSAAELPHSLGLAQLALVTLREGFEGLVVPSKLQGYMARGVPTLYVGPHSDAEQVLSASGGGKCFRNDAIQQIAEYVESLIERPEQLQAMTDAAVEYYNRHLGRASGLQKYERLIGSFFVAATR